MDPIIGFFEFILGAGLCLIFIGIMLLPYYLIFLAGRWLLRKTGILSYPASASAKRADVLPRSVGYGNKAALLCYIDDAARMGHSEERIRGALSEKGWPPEEVESAFARYREIRIKGGQSPLIGAA